MEDKIRLSIEDLGSVAGGSDNRFGYYKVCCIKCSNLVSGDFTKEQAEEYIKNNTCKIDGGPLEAFYVG